MVDFHVDDPERFSIDKLEPPRSERMSLEADWQSRGAPITDVLERVLDGRNLSEALEDCLRRRGLSSAYIRRTLVPRYLEHVRGLLKDFLEDYRRLYDLAHILKQNLQLGYDWILAAASLSAQDVAVTRKAEQLCIPLTVTVKRTRRIFHKNTRTLLKNIREKLESQGLTPSKFGIFEAYSEEYRNKVIHRGLQIDRRTAVQILESTKDLFTELDLVE